MLASGTQAVGRGIVVDGLDADADGIGTSRSGGEPRVVTPVTRRASLGQARPRAACCLSYYIAKRWMSYTRKCDVALSMYALCPGRRASASSIIIALQQPVHDGIPDGIFGLKGNIQKGRGAHRYVCPCQQ